MSEERYDYLFRLARQITCYQHAGFFNHGGSAEAIQRSHRGCFLRGLSVFLRFSVVKKYELHSTGTAEHSHQLIKAFIPGMILLQPSDRGSITGMCRLRS